MKRFLLILPVFLYFSILPSANTITHTGARILFNSDGIFSGKTDSGTDLQTSSPQAPDLSLRIEPSGQVCAGVNIHFVTGREKDLDMIADAGFKYIRMDFHWQRIERVKGKYDWSGYDELTANLKKRGLKALYILDYSNSLYEDTVVSINPLTGKERKDIASPQHPESVNAFAEWAAAAAERYKDYDILWEIWNEPNITFWKPKPDVNQYTALALATAKAIKKVVPEAHIIGPATSELPIEFLETFLGSGMAEYLDAVSVHPYRNYSKSPETVSGEYRQLRELIGKHSPADKRDLPIISSEWGYATHTKGISLEKQAEYIVRMQLVNLLNNIPVSIWYDWQNDGQDPAEKEHNFGTVTYDLKPKPAYTAIKTLNRQLDGYTLLQRLALNNDSDYVLVFKNDEGKYKLCAWTSESEHTVTLAEKIPESKRASAVNGYNRKIKLNSDQGKLTINLKSLPQYIDLPEGIQL